MKNTDKAVSWRQSVLAELDWLENEAVYCDEVDVQEHAAILQEIESYLI